jgi:hypothetical protein
VKVTVVGRALFLTSTADLSTGGARARAGRGGGRVTRLLTLHQTKELVIRREGALIWARLCQREGRKKGEGRRDNGAETHVERVLKVQAV